MKIQLVADGHTDAGGMALVLHNERLADPLDQITRRLAGFTKKRNKTEADHLEIARTEFFGGLYTSSPITTDEDGEITSPAGAVAVLPAWNMLRCLQDGAKRHKRGPDVLRGVHPLNDNAAIEYDGPSNPQELWESGKFSLRKTVGVQRARTMRTRPIFTEWRAVLPVELDMTVFDVDTLQVFWADAGRYAGIGEMRPVYGRFRGTVEVSG